MSLCMAFGNQIVPFSTVSHFTPSLFGNQNKGSDTLGGKKSFSWGEMFFFLLFISSEQNSHLPFVVTRFILVIFVYQEIAVFYKSEFDS